MNVPDRVGAGRHNQTEFVFMYGSQKTERQLDLLCHSCSLLEDPSLPGTVATRGSRTRTNWNSLLHSKRCHMFWGYKSEAN